MADENTSSEQEAFDHWNDDKLDRKAQAELLTGFLEQQFERIRNEGRARQFVLNINSPWGFGAYSRPRLPLIPDEACHPFHAKAATDSTAKLPPWHAA